LYFSVADKKYRHEVINLALFVPWEQFFGISSGSILDAWQQYRRSLPGRLQMYSDNLSLLYKSAEDAKVDANLWHSRTEWDDVLDELPDEADNVMQLEESRSTVEFDEKMQLFQGSVAQMLDQVRDIVPNASLCRFLYHSRPTRDLDTNYGSHLLSDLHRRLVAYLQDMSDEIRPQGGVLGLIAGWKRTLDQDDKTIKKAILGIGRDCDSKTSDGITQEPLSGEQPDLDAFGVHEDGYMVYSTPLSQQQETTVTKEQVDIRSYLEIARDVADDRGLNEKQRLFLFGCASHLDSIQNEGTLPGYPESGSDPLTLVPEPIKKQRQLLLYAGGEGGTGKSVCNHSLVELFERKQKRSAIIVTATSGTAGFNIRGITIHSALGLNTRDSKFQSTRVKGEDLVCWQAKEVIVIDECSMLSAQMLVQVDRRLRILRRCDDLPFGGIPIVLLTGDFMQFAPIGGSSLMQNPMEKRKRQQEDDKLPNSLSQAQRDHHTGHEIFQLFENVVILTEQMRQSADPEFGNILRRIREHQQTAEDLRHVNSRVTSYHNIDFCGGTQMITKTNVMRHTVNLDVAFQYATSKCQPLHIFLSNHWVDVRTPRYGVESGRNSARSPSKQELSDAFEIMDNTENHTPAYFPFIPGMPVMITKNIFQGLGVVNGSVFTAIDVLLDPLSERFELSDGVVIHSMPPTSLLITSPNTQSIQLPGLDRGIIPLLPISEPVTRKRRPSFTWRTALPCTPAFAITDYKSQSQSFDKICVDIDSHSSFSSMYVDLSRGRRLEGVSLLRPISETIWNREPPSNVKVGMTRLEELSKKTLEKWRNLLIRP
jgi:PIF1-like helicase